MKHKTLFVCLFFSLFACNCTQKETTTFGALKSGVEINHLQAFSIILSSAVYNEPELRAFLKEEALKQIDNDYDVFYPWVKDSIVDGTRSLREILKKYDSENVLESIEQGLPLLTIYIPDWSWLDPHCFSVCTWDTSGKDVAVSFQTRSQDKPLYGAGQLLGTIEEGCFLDHPVIIVKNNERIEVSGIGTKALDRGYRFVDSAYDGIHNNSTKGLNETEYNFSISSASAWFNVINIPSKVLTAYTQSSSVPNMPQRDNVYYDMTSQVDTGAVNIHQMERIFKFKLNQSTSAWYDDQTSQGADSDLYYYKSPGVDFTESQIKALAWDDGNLELVFYVRAGDVSLDKHKSVSMGSAFSASKVFYEYYTNLFGSVTWRKYYTYSQYLVPKWITAEHNLFTWNLKYYPYHYTIAVEEKDSGATVTRTMTDSYQFATNITTSITTGTDIKYGYSTGMSNTTTHSSTITETYQQGNDSLGSIVVEFSHPIIQARNDIGNQAKLFVYSTGAVDIIMLPQTI